MSLRERVLHPIEHYRTRREQNIRTTQFVLEGIIAAPQSFSGSTVVAYNLFKEYDLTNSDREGVDVTSLGFLIPDPQTCLDSALKYHKLHRITLPEAKRKSLKEGATRDVKELAQKSFEKIIKYTGEAARRLEVVVPVTVTNSRNYREQVRELHNFLRANPQVCELTADILAPDARQVRSSGGRNKKFHTQMNDFLRRTVRDDRYG